ncbi:hypothetical protein EDD86DRAFT_198900 [Gorgonomyces haynaldii]|nr:hypothetical protein EDD86DRAFT_198900 [Gorgonomyces haynaldii]
MELNTTDVIESFLDQDLTQEQYAFTDWMQHKHFQRKGLKLNLRTDPIDTIMQHIHELSEDELKIVIQRLEKNKNSFDKWIQHKQALAKQQKDKAEAKRRQLEETKRLQQEQKEKQKQLIDKRIEEWKHQKEQQRKRELEEKKKIQTKEQEERLKKHEIAEQKFQQWKEQKKHSKPAVVKYPNVPWVPLLPPKDTLEPAKRGILSPPSLYNEYNKYLQQAPQFVKKYPNFVASAGQKR